MIGHSPHDPAAAAGAAIAEHVVRHLDEPHEAVSAALRRLEPVRPLGDAVTALGLADLVSFRGDESPSAADRAVSFGLTWILAGPELVQVAWTLSAAPAGPERTRLAASVRATAASTAGTGRLLAAWPLLGRLVEAHTRRMLDTVAALSEQPAETSAQPGRAELAAA